MIAVVTVINLRGIKESGTFFAVPTYVFILSTLALITVGLGRIFYPTCSAHCANWRAEWCRDAGVIPAAASLLGRLYRDDRRRGDLECDSVVPQARISQCGDNADDDGRRVLGLMFLGISVLANYYGARCRTLVVKRCCRSSHAR